MALSMDEQRMLAEIEQRLAAEDPVLAARLSAFRRPSRVSIFRSARARVIGSLLTVAVVAMVSLMVYAILPFRSGSRTPGHPVTVSSTGTGQPKIGVGPGAKTAGNAAGTNTTNRNTTRSASTAASAPAKSAAARAASGSTVRQGASTRPSSAAARGSSGTTAQPASTAGQSP
jgi:Protein of unknown function (DUF3040)